MPETSQHQMPSSSSASSNLPANVEPLRTNSGVGALSPAHPFDPATTLIRMPELEALTGLARATVYKRLKDDPSFPKPVPLSNSTARGAPVGFVLSEVQNWIRGRIAARGVAA